MKPLATDVDCVNDKVRRALCPGSFDPVTNGHLDVIDRAASLYDQVVVAVSINESKSSMFDVDERRNMLEETLVDYENVRVDSYRGLTVDYCREHDIAVIVKGLRAVSDFVNELQQAQMNRSLAGIDTLFMPTNQGCSFLASSRVKEITKGGGDVSALVPLSVLDKLTARTTSPS
jgi:pantetheine-phosphate adenylyltransferase